MIKNNYNDDTDKDYVWDDIPFRRLGRNGHHKLLVVNLDYENSFLKIMLYTLTGRYDACQESDDSLNDTQRGCY